MNNLVHFVPFIIKISCCFTLSVVVNGYASPT